MRLACALFCVMLAGCATYRPQPLDPARLAQDFGARSLDAPLLRAYIEKELGRALPAWPPARWDRRMLTLTAGFHSSALAAARARLQAAQAGAAAAGAKPNPTLDFPFEYALNHQGGGLPYTGGPSLGWTIETGGKRQARADQAASLALAAQYSLLDTAWKLRSEIRAAMLALYGEERKAALLEARAAWLASAAAMLERRLQLGAATGPELSHARLLLSQARAEQTAAQEARDGARARLATAIGISTAAMQTAAIDFAEFAGSAQAAALPDPARARRAAVPARADLRAALAEYDAAQAALRQEVARQYPDLHLGTGYVYDAGTSKISFGLGGVTLPLFDDHRAAIAQAEARRTELAIRVEGMQAAILNEVDAGLARYRQRLAAVGLAASQATLAASRKDSAAAGFEAGSVDRLELAQARAEFQLFLLDQLNAALALQAAAGQLEDAMQQPLATAADALASAAEGAAE